MTDRAKRNGSLPIRFFVVAPLRAETIPAQRMHGNGEKLLRLLVSVFPAVALFRLVGSLPSLCSERRKNPVKWKLLLAGFPDSGSIPGAIPLKVGIDWLGAGW